MRCIRAGYFCSCRSYTCRGRIRFQDATKRRFEGMQLILQVSLLFWRSGLSWPFSVSFWRIRDIRYVLPRTRRQKQSSDAILRLRRTRNPPFFPYPHFGQIRAILRLLPQVTSCGDTELAVGCHIAATRGHSSATVPRCLRYRHSKSLTVQPPLPVYGCFRTLRYLQLCCRRYHIYPQGHADFCRYSSVQIPQIPGFGLLHYP